MYKKLTDDRLINLINAGIDEFAEKGFTSANLNAIAVRAGVSVGVIYKYFKDKEEFFLFCVRDCLKELNNTLCAVVNAEGNLKESLERVIDTLIAHAKKNKNINRMYHEITSGGARKYADVLAKEVELESAGVYTELIKKAKESGECKTDIDPGLFAFFTDNLFMMVQFSFCCDYYRERIKIYCGADIFENEERVKGELIKFIAGALGIRG